MFGSCSTEFHWILFVHTDIEFLTLNFYFCVCSSIFQMHKKIQTISTHSLYTLFLVLEASTAVQTKAVQLEFLAMWRVISFQT